MTGAEDILKERARQVEEEGYTPDRDKGRFVELISAAQAYISSSEVAEAGVREGHKTETIRQVCLYPPAPDWPWGREYWKPTGDPAKDLMKAGALIAAAIDSLTPIPTIVIHPVEVEPLADWEVELLEGPHS